ncbi:MAG: hypothetical protein HDQ95_08760 [Roseburia sp.]|nr:hypothetical protein [Roseburia sp.]
MGQKDLSAKELTSYPDVVADLINVFVYGGNAVVHPEELRPYNTGENIIDTQGILKGMLRDNCMESLRDGTRYMLVGIENQDDVDYTMPVRVMGYDYAGYARQLEELAAENKRAGKDMGARRIQKGQKIKPVVTFVLYYGGRDDMPAELLQMLDVPKDDGLQKYIKNYEMNLICLRDMTLSQVQSFRSDFACVAKYLSRNYNKKQLIDELRKEEILLTHMKATLYTLAAVSGDDRYLKIKEHAKEGETEMCELLDEIEKIGYEKGLSAGVQQGMQRGISQGIQRGISKGEVEKTRVVAANMIKRGMSDDDIRALAECSQELIDQIRSGM